MRYIQIDDIQPNTKLGKGLHDNSGRLLLQNQTVLTPKILEILKSRGFSHLFIEDEMSQGVEPEEVLSATFKKQISDAVKNFDVFKVQSNAVDISDKVLSSVDLSTTIYTKNDDIFMQSINATEIALTIARHMGYNHERLTDLAVACTLQDVGKLCGINDDYLKRLNLHFSDLKIAEYDDKMHPVLGYRMFSQSSILKATVKQSILFHTENYDGSGLLKVSGEKIHEFARIIRLADVYLDIVTNKDNLYHIETVSDAIEFIASQSGKMFDPNIVSIFLEKVPVYPPGLTVSLDDGRQAVVVANNKDYPTRPIIRTDGFEQINLMDRENLTLKIVGIYQKEQEELTK